MTSYRTLETALSAHTNQQHSVKGDATDEKWGLSGVKGSIFGKRRPHHKVATTSFTAAFTAVVLASLVGAYVLLVCYHYLSRFHVRDAPRILASKFPDEDGNECVDSLGDGNGGEQPAGQPSPSPGEWTLPQMPEGVRRIMAGALRMLAKPAARCRAVAPHLTRPQLISLIYPVTSIAALELSGFAFLPPELQPLRKWASREYLDLSSSLLEIGPGGPRSGNIPLLLLFTRRLGEEPKNHFRSDPGVYERVMVSQYRLFHIANANVLTVFDELTRWVSPETSLIPNARVELAARTLQAIYGVRCRQILSNFFTRYWINTRQKRVKKFFFYTMDMLKKAVPFHLGPLADEGRKIIDAVKSARGEPSLSFSSDPGYGRFVSTDIEATGGQAQHASGFGGVGTRRDGAHAFPQDLQGAGETAAPLLFGASHGKSFALSKLFFGTKAKLTKADFPTGTAGSGVESSLAKEGSEEQQAGPHHFSVDEGAAEAFGATPSTSAGSASASASESAGTGGQMGEVRGDEKDEDLLHLIEQALDWKKAFVEEAGES